MGRQKCVRLNGKEKVFTFKWKDKKSKCTFKWQGKSVRLNGKTKVYV